MSDHVHSSELSEIEKKLNPTTNFISDDLNEPCTKNGEISEGVVTFLVIDDPTFL